jgi:uncharacterized protein
MAALDVDVARQPAQPEGESAGKGDQQARDNQQQAGGDEQAAEGHVYIIAEGTGRPGIGNLRKHGVSLNEAASVFFDPLSATGDDPDHSLEESRFVTFGKPSSGRLLVVAHAEQDGSIRIITAREATRAERKLYEEG